MSLLLALTVVGCSSDERDEPNEGAPSPATSADGGAPLADAATAPPRMPLDFEACSATLKQRCSYEDTEQACASIITAPIPLTDGTTWGNLELKGGPSGAYVEWNEGIRKVRARPLTRRAIRASTP